MGKIEPKHCPNCGSENIHNQELETSNDTSELYDTYCRDCKWSGNISSDLPLNNKKTLQEIISILQTLKPTLLQQYGVETIGVFGSYVREEQNPKKRHRHPNNLQKRRPPRIIRAHGSGRVFNEKVRHKSRLGNKRLTKTTHRQTHT
jgi:hypothetical protein